MKLNNSIYDKVLVMGIGTVAAQCVIKVKKVFENVIFLETRSDTVMSQEAVCNRNAITFVSGGGKVKITKYLQSLTEKTLIVSVSNRYLFPSYIIEKHNLTIINYHGALLPKYPGRNAEAWAIYGGEEMGGITWHVVTADVDAGEIITQVKVPITDKTTSFTLLREYGRAAQSSFAEMLPSLLDGSVKTHKQEGERGQLILSNMRPHDNVLDAEWDAGHISRFLRALDYGPLEVMGKPMIDGYPVLKYHIIEETNKIETTEYNEGNSEIIIHKRDLTFRLEIDTNYHHETNNRI